MLGAGGRRAGRRARRRDRAPRREAVEHPGHRRRTGEALRLRHRPGRGGRVAHPDRAGHRLAGLPRPRGRVGRAGHRASDVWSLGATLYHALAGQPPYEVGDNLSARSTGSSTRSRPAGQRRLAGAGAGGDDDPRTGGRWSMDQVREFLTAGPPPPCVPLRAAHRGGPHAERPTPTYCRRRSSRSSRSPQSSRRCDRRVGAGDRTAAGRPARGGLARRHRWLLRSRPRTRSATRLRHRRVPAADDVEPSAEPTDGRGHGGLHRLPRDRQRPTRDRVPS